MLDPLVDLSEFDGLGLIFKTMSGVSFTNQVAGLGCLHPQVEGIFAPLPVVKGRPELHALRSHFRGWWRSLQPVDADIVDGILRRNGKPFLSVDRELLLDSYEAWIHVNVNAGECPYMQNASNWHSAVLTWQNSD